MSSFEVTYLTSQYLMVVFQIGLIAMTWHFYKTLVSNDNLREARVLEDRKIKWCKAVFAGVDSPGALQRAGRQLRERFPKDSMLVLRAYEELLVELPSRSRPRLYEFLDSMNGYEPDEKYWPKSALAYTGNLDVFGTQQIE